MDKIIKAIKYVSSVVIIILGITIVILVDHSEIDAVDRVSLLLGGTIVFLLGVLSVKLISIDITLSEIIEEDNK